MSIALAALAVRIAFTIVLDAAALIVWDIGTRSPAALLADIRAGVRDRSTLVVGLVRFATGALAVLTGVAVSLPIFGRSIDFTIVECLALVTALVVEALVGPVLRARNHTPQG